MTTPSTLKLLALGAVVGMTTIGSAFADESNDTTGTSYTDAEVAAAWSRYEKAGDWNNHYLTNSVTGWAVKTGNHNLKINGIRANPQGLTHLDLSTLDGVQCEYLVTELSASSFLNNKAVMSMKLPKTLKTLGANTFCHTTDPKFNVFVDFNGASLEYIGASALANSTNDQDYVVFTNAETVLSFVMQGPIVLELPKATTIGLFGSSTLKHVIIPYVRTIAGGAFGGCGAKVIKYPYWLKECYTLKYNDTFGTSPVPLYGFYSWVDQNKKTFIHRESEFASESAGYLTTTDNGVVKLYAGTDTTYPRDQKVPVVLYGGKVSADGAEWVYDDTVWNEENETYDIQSTNMTIVAALGVTGDVEIPKKLNNVPITAIEACAFKTNEFTSVTLPKTVARIGVAAFPKGCFIKVKDGPHANRLVDQLNAEYGKVEGTEDKYYASVDEGDGTVIIVR